MNTYQVTVTRLQPQSVTFTVSAETEAGARRAALDTCGDEIFESSGEAYDEQVESCDPLAKEALSSWKVVCKQIVDMPSDIDDRDDLNLGKDGKKVWHYAARGEEDALDMFHYQNPVGCLEDYEITAEPEEG